MPTQNSILLVNDVVNCGLRISSDIRDEEIQFSIDTVEKIYVAPTLGDLYNQIISSPASYTDLLNGKNGVPGLKLALEHLVYAYLLYDTVYATRFTSVIKDSDESHQPSIEQIFKLSNHHWELGCMALKQILTSLELPVVQVNNMASYFCEFLWCNGNKDLL